jgi:hypothetical protein
MAMELSRDHFLGKGQYCNTDWSMPSTYVYDCRLLVLLVTTSKSDKHDLA